MQRMLETSIAIVILAGIGCSAPAGGPTTTPEQATETPEAVATVIMKAVSTKDEAAFMATLTQKARDAMESAEDGGFSGDDYESFEVGAAVIDGVNASVPVEAVNEGETQKMSLKLRQEAGDWKLFAIGIVLAPDAEMTVNFENIDEMMQEMATGLGEALGDAISSGMQAAFQMGSPEEAALKIAMFDALEPVNSETFESSWKLSENYRGKPRAEALSAIAESIDLSIHVGAHKDVLSEAVGFDTSDLSRLEAVERIANEAGLFSALPNLQDWGIASALMQGMADTLGAVVGGSESLVSINGDGAEALVEEARQVETPPKNTITFNTDTPPMPPLFMGPFRLDLAQIEENVPHATGNLVLQLTAHGLPSPVLSVLETHNDSFQVQEVVGSDGNPLIDMDVSYMGGGSAVGTAYHDTASRELTGLLRSVDRIARITGMVELPRPTSIEELDFAKMEAGASQTMGGLTVTVDQVSAFASFKITGPEDVVESLVIHAQPYNADDEPVVAHFSDYQSWQPGEGTFSLNTDEAPARVRLKFVLASEMSLYPFAFNAVPLAHASEQPDQLATLDYGAHDAPLKMTFIEITKRDPQFSEAKIAVENVSNKSPKNAFVDFVYLDAAGNELKSFPHTINGSFNASGWGPLAKPGEKVDTDQTAFQMPKNTQSISFRFNHVDFMDGTRWEPEPDDN